MYLPTQRRKTATNKKLRALGAATFFSASLIGCSGTAQPTTNVVEPAVVPIVVPPTPTLQATIAALATELPAPVDPTPIPVLPTATSISTGQYVDGDYLGDAIATDRWGYTQVHALVTDGMLVDIEIIQYPHSKSRSAQISSAAFPTLISEAIQNQNADINILTRATDTSIAFIRSLSSALDEALAEGS